MLNPDQKKRATELAFILSKLTQARHDLDLYVHNGSAKAIGEAIYRISLACSELDSLEIRLENEEIASEE